MPGLKPTSAELYEIRVELFVAVVMFSLVGIGLMMLYYIW